MLEFLDVLPVEIRCIIAEYLGIEELVRPAINGIPDALQVFGDYPNDVLDIARRASTIYPVLETLGLLPPYYCTPMFRYERTERNIISCCVHWALLDDHISPISLEQAKNVVNSQCMITSKMLKPEQKWILNGATRLGMKKVRKNIVDRCGSFLTDIQLNVAIHRISGFRGVQKGLYYLANPCGIVPCRDYSPFCNFPHPVQQGYLVKCNEIPQRHRVTMMA